MIQTSLRRLARGSAVGVALGTLALAAGPARAQEHPLYLPTRDVTVVYAVTSKQNAAPSQARMLYSASAERMRLDAPGQQGFVIIDHADKQVTVVMLAQHLYMQQPLDPNMATGFMLNASMKFSRTGSKTIAGTPCTEWAVQSTRASGNVCVSKDGVVLEGHGTDHDGNGGGVQAVSVNYAAQPADMFAPPAGFTKMAMPPMPQPGGAPGGAGGGAN